MGPAPPTLNGVVADPEAPPDPLPPPQPATVTSARASARTAIETINSFLRVMLTVPPLDDSTRERGTSAATEACSMRPPLLARQSRAAKGVRQGGALPRNQCTPKRFVASDKKVLEGRRTPSPACRRQADRRGAILMAVDTSRAWRLHCDVRRDGPRREPRAGARRDQADGALTPARVLARRATAATAGAARRVCGPCRCRRSTTGWSLRRRCPSDAMASQRARNRRLRSSAQLLAVAHIGSGAVEGAHADRITDA